MYLFIISILFDTQLFFIYVIYLRIKYRRKGIVVWITNLVCDTASYENWLCNLYLLNQLSEK